MLKNKLLCKRFPYLNSLNWWSYYYSIYLFQALNLNLLTGQSTSTTASANESGTKDPFASLSPLSLSDTSNFVSNVSPTFLDGMCVLFYFTKFEPLWSWILWLKPLNLATCVCIIMSSLRVFQKVFLPAKVKLILNVKTWLLHYLELSNSLRFSDELHLEL